MKTQNLFFIFIIFCCFSSCTKTDDKEYTISGHLYETCGVPAANHSFLFYQGSGRGSKEAGWVTTDANGAFKLTYKRNNGIDLQVGYPGGASFMRIRSNADYNNIEIYKRPICTLKVGMQVYNNNYTSQDTLTIGDFRTGDLLKIAGPFQTGVLYQGEYTIRDYSYDGDNLLLPKLFWINNVPINQMGVELHPCENIDYTLEIR